MLSSSATANPVLAGTLRKYFREPSGYVGRVLAPIFLTAQQSAAYYVFDKDNALNIPRNITRAPGTNYVRTQLKVSDDTFNCSNKGIEIPIDDEEREKYATAFSADEEAMRRVRDIVISNHEFRVKDLATGGSVQNSSPTNKWNDYDNTSSNPVGDVDVVKEVIRTGSGLTANTMILPMIVFNALKEHPAILEKIKYSQRGVVTREILQEVFGIPNIVVAGMVENTANEGQAMTIADIWGESVIICHSEQSSNLEAPNFLRTFVWSRQTGSDGITVESYREDAKQSDIHRAKQHTDEKLTGYELGYHLSNTLE